MTTSLGEMLDNSWSYAKEGVWGKGTKWLLLIVSLIIFPLILGYSVRIYRGEKPAPELQHWGTMFIDGLKLLVVCLIYALPIILLVIVAFVPFVMALITSGAITADFASMTTEQTNLWITAHPEIMSAALFMAVLLLVTAIVSIVITIFSFIGIVRFARTGKMRESFNFSEILSQIGRIGWLNYIAALIFIGITSIVFWVLLHVFALIPVIGEVVFVIVALVLYPPYILFVSRYAALVYERGEPAVAVSKGQ
jgi:hypothetical protein